MKKHLLTFVLALVVGVLGFAVSGIATAGDGQPPGQGPCSHGETGTQCKDDPSDNGKDCDEHGNNGGVNEDHCQETDTTPTETTPTETTPTDTTPTETTPTETTPTETTPTETTPTGTTPTETTPSGSSTPPATAPQETTPVQSSQPPASSPESPKSPPSIVGTPPKAQHNLAAKSPAKSAVAGVHAKSAPKPTRKAQPAPFTL